MFTEAQKAIANISDSLQKHSFALHAFASLLATADLGEFTGNESPDTCIESNIDKQELRQGLRYIIELYLAHQQKLLNDQMESSYEGNSWLVNRASNLISWEESGLYSSKESAINELMVAIAVLDMVINKKQSTRDGCTEQAKELRAACLKRIEKLKEP